MGQRHERVLNQLRQLGHIIKLTSKVVVESRSNKFGVTNNIIINSEREIIRRFSCRSNVRPELFRVTFEIL